MANCFICNAPIKEEVFLNIVKCNCKNCKEYAYEKNFLTTYKYYLSVHLYVNLYNIHDLRMKNVIFVK